VKAGDAFALVTKKLGIPSCGPCARRQKAWNDAHDKLMNALEELISEDNVELNGWEAKPIQVFSFSSEIRGVEQWYVIVRSSEGRLFQFPDDYVPLSEKPHRKVVEYFLKEAMRLYGQKTDGRAEKGSERPSNGAGAQGS
jgi:hypothetical protein